MSNLLVYWNDGKTYIIKGDKITDLVGIKMLKASGVAVVSHRNVRHIKQLIFHFNTMETKGDYVNLLGDGIGRYNIPVKDIVEVSNARTFEI